MPFKKVGPDDYTSPTGRHFNQKQVGLYYHLGGHFPGEKHAEGGMVTKFNSKPKDAAYAEGGAVLPRAKDFKKDKVNRYFEHTVPDEFRDPDEGKMESKDVVGDTADKDQKYGKSGKGKGEGFVRVPKETGKSLKPVKPRG